MALNQYFIPPAKTTSVLPWLKEAQKESELFLENQFGWKYLDEDLRIVNQHFPELATGLHNNPAGSTAVTRVHVPQVKRMVSELTAILGNIEPSWTHTPSNKGPQGITDPAIKQLVGEGLEQVSNVLDRCTRVWWERTYAVEQIVGAIQQSVTQRTGYIFPIWNPHFHATNQGDIELIVGGPKDYYPLWLNRTLRIQEAYAGTIRVKMPITEFAVTWPTLAMTVRPDDEQDTTFGTKAANLLRGAAELFNPTDHKKRFAGQVPAVTVYYTYIRDMSMNLTGNTACMGMPGTNSYYEVPPYGKDLPTGRVNDATGSDLTRKAGKEDTYLYPWLRLVIWTEQVLCYDGPSFWFHGKIPAIKLTLDPWPNDYLGGSIVRDIASLEEANNRLIRSIDQRVQLKSKPPRQVNMDLIDNTTAEALERLIVTPAALVKVDSFREGDVLRPLYSPQDLQVEQWEIEYYKSNKDEMQDILGLNNLQRMSEMRGGAIPGGDSADKLLEITGARTQRKGHIMERFCSEMAPMVDALIFQWYDTNFRWKLSAYQGIATYDWDFDPGTLVPSDIPGLDSRSALYDTRAKRAKYLVASMGVQIERGSLLDITSMTRQLLEMKLWQDPMFPKDPITMGEALKFTNMGTLDDTEDDDTRIGRAIKFSKKFAEHMAATQKIMQGADPQQALAGALQQMGSQVGGGGQPEGRPNTYQSAPSLQTRTDENGTRPIIDTSQVPH